MVLIKPWFWKAFEIVPEFKLPVEFRTGSRHMSSSGPTAIGMPVSLGAYKFSNLGDPEELALRMGYTC